jgi:hypothetical protein
MTSTGSRAQRRLTHSRDIDQHSLLDLALMTNAIDCITSLRSLGCPEREDCAREPPLPANAPDFNPATRAERLNRIRKQRVVLDVILP